MELYPLDALFRRVAVVDKFESLIWTERFSAMGDFELMIANTDQVKSLLVPGLKLAMNESYRVMEVKTVNDATDDEGRNMLKVTGPSIESITDDRAARRLNNLDLTEEPKWVIEDTPGNIARKVFHDICVTGVLSPYDVIPFINEGRGPFSEDTISEPTEEITIEIEPPATVYSVVQQVCDLYDIGFRLIRNVDTSQLWFDVYSGSDRTSGQTTLPAVIFSPDLDNLRNTSELNSTAAYKNVAVVISPAGIEWVMPLDVDPSVSGFQRRVLVVKADDIEVGDPNASAKMIQRGNEELRKHRRFSGFDGEIVQNSKYKYGRDFQLGDLVTLQNRNGFATNMQVTEQIFVSDREGDRSYPTLAVNTYITPGSWLSWDFNQVWEDLDDEEWADQ